MMIKRFVFIISLISGVLLAQNPRVIDGGTFTGNQRWSGIIEIRGDVVIDENANLIIDPGTEIRFAANHDNKNLGSDKTRCELIIKGSVIARGTVNQKITFTSSAEDQRMGDWYGIEVMNKKKPAAFEYVIIEFAYNGLECKMSDPQIKNSYFRYNYNAGLQFSIRSGGKIIGCIISDNGYAGIILDTGASPIFTDNVITKNQIGIIAFGTARPNLGNLERGNDYNPGRNGLFDNEEYDVYNHTGISIKAEGNSWGSQELELIASQIYDAQDDPKYGEVDFNPIVGNIDLQKKLLVAQQPVARESAPTPAPPRAEQPRSQQRQTQSVTRPTSQPATEATKPETPPTRTKTTPPAETEKPARQVAEETKPATSTTTLAAREETKPVPEASTPATTTASTEPEPEPVEEEPPAPAIDFNQVFLEVFLDKRPEKIKRVAPVVRDLSRGGFQKGNVIVKIIVGKDGSVEEAKVLRGLNEYYDQLAEEAARKFKFKPGTVQGVPVRFTTTLLFKF